MPQAVPGSQSPMSQARPEQSLPSRMLRSPHTPVTLGILGTNEFHLQLLFWARTCLHPAGLCSHLARSLSLPLTCPQTQISWGTDSYRHLWSVIHPAFSRVSSWVYHMIYPLTPKLFPLPNLILCSLQMFKKNQSALLQPYVS